LDKAFLEQDTVWVAERLVGCHLIRKTALGTIRVEIIETEAYRGNDDPASHAYRGITSRNQWMFGDVGRLYVYFIYGMHFCMNVVAHRKGEVGAVLLRAGRPIEGLELIRANRPKISNRNLINGPAKLTQAMQIDMSFNGYDLLQPNDEFWLEFHEPFRTIHTTPRIGITKGKELPWRFSLSL
jgi:DNA-3-methyladenine glycosylase